MTILPEWIIQVLGLLVGIVGGILLSPFVERFHGTPTAPSALSIVLSVGLLVAWIGAMIWNEKHKREAESAKPVYFGEVVPASGRDDPSLPAGLVRIELGGGLSVLAGESGNHVLAVSDKPVVSIARRDNRIRLTAMVTDSQNRRIATIIGNEFNIDPHSTFNPKQPDPHSIVVRDIDGVEVLNLRFKSPRVLQLYGRFRIPGESEPLVFDREKGAMLPRNVRIAGFTLDLSHSPGSGFLALN